MKKLGFLPEGIMLEFWPANARNRKISTLPQGGIQTSLDIDSREYEGYITNRLGNRHGYLARAGFPRSKFPGLRG